MAKFLLQLQNKYKNTTDLIYSGKNHYLQDAYIEIIYHMQNKKKQLQCNRMLEIAFLSFTPEMEQIFLSSLSLRVQFNTMLLLDHTILNSRFFYIMIEID